MRHAWKPLGRQKAPQLLYLTYFVHFPNGATWVRQEPIVHGLEHKLQQLRAEHIKDFRWKHQFDRLQRTGEMWWKDEHKIEHHFKIEKTKRAEVWGGRGTQGGARVMSDQEVTKREEKLKELGVFHFDN